MNSRLNSFVLQEVHIIHEFPEDFYNVAMRVLILAYIRPEQNYPSLGEDTDQLFSFFTE